MKSTAQKRRYSSTAVEFPKFDDLKPHTWGFPPIFPQGQARALASHTCRGVRMTDI